MSTETPAATNPFSELVNALKAAFQPPSTPSVSGSPMAMPATFAGEAAECSGFLLQVNLFIKMQPQLFTSDDAKVAFLISLLTGKALLWAKAIWNAENPIIHSYEQFTNHFTEVFSTTTGELATSDQLFRLQQGTSSVNHYTLHFCTLAAASGWNEKALLGAYRQGLSPDLQAAMALYDDSIGLEAFQAREEYILEALAHSTINLTGRFQLLPTLEELCGAQVFTKLDLRSAYNLVRIRAGDEWKTAFVTPTGHYEYRVMPYGLSISPSVFQTFMNEEFLHRFVIVYIDILIYSRNMAEHRHHVQQEWPQPLTVKELQRFLGFANFYRRFIKDYSTITAPLTSLLRGKPKTICWNPPAHEAFLQLKKIFSTVPLLHHPDPELPFTVEVDASTTGAGALSPAEQNYDVGNRELLAIKLALEEWRHWLEDQPVEPEPIVPSNLIVSPIVWEMDEDIRSATLQEAAPPKCPEGKIFVPLTLRQDLLDTAHRSPGSGHPGSQQTLSLLQSRYWWPSKLVPLPIPQRPWSHIGVDFVTDLPAAEGNTCILVMVD
ncbi:Transposon Tf2-8 polyprotein [Labeo rohita]|uniref:Gypsy retrotransposon integrase-like protein 1 n=1 Tax=Labeo rohita TaxID=84645 RepID=A0ABQ8M5L2_LABRO|nr:Transposon Tf2-8 polyprotein [Labeo rohita]